MYSSYDGCSGSLVFVLLIQLKFMFILAVVLVSNTHQGRHDLAHHHATEVPSTHECLQQSLCTCFYSGDHFLEGRKNLKRKTFDGSQKIVRKEKISSLFTC